jgi:hypothetical protein
LALQREEAIIMQEDANRGVPHGVGGPVTNASTASAQDAESRSTGMTIALFGGGLVALAILAAWLV